MNFRFGADFGAMLLDPATTAISSWKRPHDQFGLSNQAAKALKTLGSQGTARRFSVGIKKANRFLVNGERPCETVQGFTGTGQKIRTWRVDG
jgi:hypothetical protein